MSKPRIIYWSILHNHKIYIRCTVIIIIISNNKKDDGTYRIQLMYQEVVYKVDGLHNYNQFLGAPCSSNNKASYPSLSF